MDCAGKDGISAEETGEEGVEVPFFTGGRSVPQKQHCGLVDKAEEAEISCMLAGGFEYKYTF